MLNAASPPTYTTTSSANTLATKITTGAWEISTVDQWVSWQANNSRVTVNELKLKTGAMTPSNATSTSIDTMMGTDGKLQLGLDGNENSTGSNDPRIYTFKSQAGPFSSVTFKSFGLNNLIYGTGLTTSTWTYPQIAFYDEEGNVVHRQEFLTLNSSTKLDVFTSTLPAGVTATSFGFMTLNADRWFVDEISMTPASNSEVGSSGTTADTTPFISGTYAITLNAGDVVQIFDGNTYLGDATIDASTKTWTYQVSTSAAAGSHAYVAKIVNAGTTVSTSNSYTVNMVAPVVLDLNHDGQIDYSQIKMDLNNDGVLYTTAWVAAQDGLLVHDVHGDGSVRSTSQFAFARHAGETDLQGLASQFDSNQDGVFNAQDAQFGEMAVWQDADQDGVADAGEVKHLADLGIKEIDLVSDGVVRTPAEGVTEAGRSAAQLADGSSMLVSDAAFAYQLNASQVTLDLTVDPTPDDEVTAFQLNVADVMAAPADANGQHVVQVKGDSNDTLNLSNLLGEEAPGQWLAAGTVQQGGVTFNTYNYSADTSLQVMVEQHLQNVTLS